MLIGGRATMNSDTQRLESILHLPQRMSKWKRVGRDIKIKRASHVAMMIPETLISCDNKNRRSPVQAQFRVPAKSPAESRGRLPL